MKNYKIGTSLEIHFKKSTPEFIKWAYELGLEHVEVKRDHDFIYPLDIDEVRKVLKEYGITIGYHAPYRDFNLSTINPHTRTNCVRQIKEIIKITHNIGGDYVNIHLGYIPEYYPENIKVKAWESCIKSLKDIVDFANDLGVKLCIENDPHKPNTLQFGERIDTLLKIVNEFDEYIKVTLDVGHAHTSKLQISEFIKVFGDKLLVVHLHDNDGTVDSHLPLGKGNINFGKVFKALSHYSKNLVFLLEMKKLEDIINSKKVLKELLKQI